jgi:hypothetical protein
MCAGGVFARLEISSRLNCRSQLILSIRSIQSARNAFTLGIHVRLRLERFSCRSAEQVLNARLAIKQEMDSVLLDPSIEVATLSRPVFNATLEELYRQRLGKLTVGVR